MSTQPQEASGPGKRSGFWDQPGSRQILPGKNYTRFVRGMRLLLPLVAASVIGLVMAWPKVQSTMAPIRKQAVSAASPAAGKNELLNPSFKGVDNSNEPYTVSAAHAVQSLSDRDTILLDKPAAEILLSGGRKVGGEAAKGSYTQKAGKLMLEGDVTLHDDEGNVFTTSKLLINTNTHEAWSDQPVQGHGPAGTLSASGVQAYGDKKILVFTAGETGFESFEGDVTIMRNVVFVFIALFFVSCFPAARAQTAPAATANPNRDQPLEINADQTLEWHRNEMQYIARGNVVARQGDATIKADMITADYRQSQKSQSDIYHLTATGHVSISSQGHEAVGDKAVYDVDSGIAIMTGQNLIMTAPDQVVTAKDNFEYKVAAGQLTANGNARAVKKTDKGEDVITADALSAWFAQDKTGKRTLDKVTAENNVVITTPTDILHGDKGEYVSGTRVASVTGHVKIERGQNVLEGNKAEIDLNTNISRMVGTPGQNGRVRGVFYPGGGNTLKPAAAVPALTPQSQ